MTRYASGEEAKVGDMIMCIDGCDSNKCVTYGDVRIVSKIFKKYIAYISEGKKVVWVRATRFELMKRAKNIIKERKVEMKTKVVKPTEAELEFPCCMQNLNGTVVLFSAPKKGTVIYSCPGVAPLGWHSKDWRINTFSKLPENTKIIIEI